VAPTVHPPHLPFCVVLLARHFFYRKGTPSLLCDNHALGFHASSQPFLASIYFITFIILAALVMMSLFIGVVTTSMDTEQNKVKAARAETDEVERIRGVYELSQERVAELRNIFEAVKLPNMDTISSDDLKFLLSVLSDNKMSPLEIEERSDAVLGEKDSGELMFSQVFQVLGKYQRETATLPTSEALKAQPQNARSPDGGLAPEDQHNGVHGASASGSFMRQRSFVDEKGRIMLPDSELKKSTGSKVCPVSARREVSVQFSSGLTTSFAQVRRILDHAEAFDFTDEVKLEGVAVTQLVCFVSAMNLYAKEMQQMGQPGNDSSKSGVAASKPCKHSSQAAQKASFFAVPPAPTAARGSAAVGPMADASQASNAGECAGHAKVFADLNATSNVTAQTGTTNGHAINDIPARVEERLRELQRLMETGLRFRTREEVVASMEPTGSRLKRTWKKGPKQSV